MGSTLRKSAYAALTFFGVLCVLSVGYSAYTGLSSVTASTPLTVGLWTQVKDNFDDVNSRLSNFSFSSGNVGIGVASPLANLHVKGGGWLRIDAANGGNEAGISLYANGWVTRRYLVRTSPDVGKEGDFEIVQFDKTTGTELNRINWPYNGAFRAPNFDIGYEVVNDTRVPGAWATSYNVYCPNGKYLLNSSVRTVGGWIEVAHDNLYNGVLVLSDRNQFNSQLASGVYTTLVCANVR